MLCYVMLCYAMLCYIILYYIIAVFVLFALRPFRRLVYRCGVEAKKRNLAYFGIQKNGECWGRSSPLGDYVGRRKRTASSSSNYQCVKGDYRTCSKPPNPSSVCVGQKYSSFMYQIGKCVVTYAVQYI